MIKLNEAGDGKESWETPLLTEIKKLNCFPSKTADIKQKRT